MTQYAMIVDYEYCTGCRSCEISCRKEKNIPLEEWGVKVLEIGPDEINGGWIWNFMPIFSSYCDLCAEKIEAGKKPPCALHCLAACMDIVPVEEVSAKLAEKGKTITCVIP